jgi:hypothetical protein
MKRILLFLFCFVGSFVANAQYPATGLKQQFKNGIALGSRDSTAFGANDSLVVSIDRNGKMIFRGNGVNAPFKVVSVTSDTAAMLLPYLRKSDTASMLAPYVRSSSLGIYLLKSDSLSGGYTTWLLTKKKVDSLGAVKLNISDTAAMLLPYARTSSLGSYLLKSDSLSGGYTTWLLTKKKVDSLGAVKLNISDTAAMLSPYVRTSGLGSYLLKSDSLSGGYTTWLLTKKKIDSLGAVKLNVLDTAAMLANRLKISDTAYMLSGYARTGNIPSTANFVPYDGATRNVNLGTNRVYANDFSLRVPSTSADTIGRFRWNADDLTANLGLTSSVVLQTGQELLVLVKNQTGVTIPNGTVVRQSGVVGSSGRLLVEPFLANGQYNSNRVLGITTEDIADGADGFVTSYGKVNGVNTAAYPDSTILYASPTVAGGLTATPPTAPNNIVKIGTVVKSANPNGIILTRIVYGSNINQDEGVQLTNPLNSSLLVYDSVTTLWKNKTLVEIGALRVQDSTFTNGYTTRLRTKQIIDSLGAVKLNISDTAAMLAGYKTYYPRTAISLTTTGSSGAATYNNATGVLNIPQYAPDLSGYVPYTGAVDNVNLGNFRLTARSLRTDSIYSNSSAGMYLLTNGGAAVAHWGGGGSVEVDFKGFAGYDANRSASYTARSFTDKGYVDSADALRVKYTDTATMLSNYRRKTTLIENADLRNSAITINGSSTALGGSVSVGTVTSVAASAGAGISVSGSPITSSGTLTITNTAPDQTVTLTAGSGISVTGTYPNFTVTNSSPSSGGTVTSVSAGTGMSFTTITSSGAVNADTTVLATRAYAAGLDVAKANTSLNNVNGVLSSTYGGAGSVSGILKANGSGVVSAAVNNTDYTLLNGTGFVRMSGTTPSYVTGASSQFVKADGSLDGTSYATAASISGTTNYIPKFTSSGAIGNSQIQDNGSEIQTAGLVRFVAGGFDSYISQSFGNTINFNYNQNATAEGWVNYRGYLNGTTQFRNFNIGDGKESLIATFTGSTKTTTLYGALSGTSLSMSGGGVFGGSSTQYLSRLTTYYNPSSNNGPIWLDSRSFGANVGAFQWFGGQYNSSSAYRPFGGIGAQKENATDGNSLGYLSFWVNQNAADATEAMRISSNRNLLIKTTTESPNNEALQVAGSGLFTGNITTNLPVAGGSGKLLLQSDGTRFGALGTAAWAFGSGGTDFTMLAESGNGIRLAVNGSTQALTLAPTGAATFSSTGTFNDNLTVTKSTGTLLDIRATSSGGTAEIKLNPTSNNAYSLYTAGGTDALEFKRNGTTLVTFSNVGAATFSSSVTATSFIGSVGTDFAATGGVFSGTPRVIRINIGGVFYYFTAYPSYSPPTP